MAHCTKACVSGTVSESTNLAASFASESSCGRKAKWAKPEGEQAIATASPPTASGSDGEVLCAGACAVGVHNRDFRRHGSRGHNQGQRGVELEDEAGCDRPDLDAGDSGEVDAGEGGRRTYRPAGGAEAGDDWGHGQLEQRAVATVAGPIEVAVFTFDQTGPRIGSIGAAREAIEGGQIASGRDLEHRAVVTGATLPAGSVEVAVLALDQSGIRLVAVGATKAVEGSQSTGDRDLEHRAEFVRAAVGTGSVEIAVGALDQAAGRCSAVGAEAGEAVEVCQIAGGRDLEHRAGTH